MPFPVEEFHLETSSEEDDNDNQDGVVSDASCESDSSSSVSDRDG